MLGDKGFLYNAITRPDPVIVDAINRSRLLPVGDARSKLLGDIQKRAVDEAFIVPLFAPAYHLAAKSTVHGVGFEPQLDGPASSYDVWVEKQGA